MKSLWITSLVKDQRVVKEIIHQAGKYGLEANGHFWEDDLKKMAWLAVKEKLRDKAVHLWVVLVSKDALTVDVRYALTLLTLAIQAERPELPILVIAPAEDMGKDDLPGVFADTPYITGCGSSAGVKFAALANMRAKQIQRPYYIAVHANPGFGVWLEVGPATGHEWAGVIVGVNQGEIKAHGYGERGRIPEKCVVEYPIKGMKLASGTTEYLAWGIQNKLTDSVSYFVKVDGVVVSCLYGPLPDDEQVDLHILRM